MNAPQQAPKMIVTCTNQDCEQPVMIVQKCPNCHKGLCGTCAKSVDLSASSQGNQVVCPHQDCQSHLRLDRLLSRVYEFCTN